MQGGADKSVSLTTHDGGGQSSPTATGDTRQGFAEFLDLKGLGEKEVNPAARRICDVDHLRRLLHAYLGYYHGARTHPSLDKDAPEPRPVERPASGRIVQTPLIGGLHHRYSRRAA